MYAGRGDVLEEALKRGYEAKVICEKEPHLRQLLRKKFKDADMTVVDSTCMIVVDLHIYMYLH